MKQTNRIARILGPLGKDGKRIALEHFDRVIEPSGGDLDLIAEQLARELDLSRADAFLVTTWCLGFCIGSGAMRRSGD